MTFANCDKKMEHYQQLENMIEEDEFVERYLHEMQQNDVQSNDVPSDDFNGLDQNPQLDENDENNGIKKSKKRRANLTEFDESQSIKRKNESAKRELTSIVNQVCLFLAMND